MAAKQGKGDIVQVSPYLNLQTFDMMMSVSKLLSDGKSVLSIDIYLDGLQEILNELVQDTWVRHVLIVDGDGLVVAHAEHGGLQGQPMAVGDIWEGDLFERVKRASDYEDHRETNVSDGAIIMAEHIGNGWYAVLVLDEGVLSGTTAYLNTILILFIALTVTTWYGISRSIDHKYREAEQLSREVNAVSDIYEAMTLVDLKTGDMTILRASEKLERLLGGDLTNFNERATALAKSMASEGSRDRLVQFMDPASFEERLEGVRSISHDLVDSDGKWIRIQLIVVDRTNDDALWHIIWAVESIEREHRQQERLKRLAETDSLTGLYNRRSGEDRIRDLIDSGNHGTFFLVDIDDFKSVNDSFGHDVGDAVICAVANCIARSFTEDDVVFRLGGDEFAAFAPHLADVASRDWLVERLDCKIAAIDLPELTGRTITASVGTARFAEVADDSFEALYQRADQRMYEKKRMRHAER